MTILKGKKILIVGVANKNSIAAGIADSMNDFGAALALSYQSEKLKSRVEALAENWNCSLLTECDVSNDSAIKACRAITEKDRVPNCLQSFNKLLIVDKIS